MKKLILVLLCVIKSNADIINLTWDASPSGGTYRLYHSVGTNTFVLSSVWTGITATATYDSALTNRWYVTTYNTNYTRPESIPSNIYTYFPLISPLPPTNLNRTFVSGNRVDLSWKSNILLSSRIERAPPYGAFTTLATVSPGILHYTTQAKKNEQWLFRVLSCSPTVCSSPSSIILVDR